MQDNAADELYPVGAHAQNPVRGLPNGGKGLRQNVVQGFALGEPLLEDPGLALQLRLGHLPVGVGHGLDLVYQRGNGFDLPLGVGSEQLGHGTGE